MRKECKFCKKSFISRYKTAKFCSRLCASNIRKGEIPHNKGILTISKFVNCPECNQKFKSSKRSNGKYTKFCSDKCLKLNIFKEKGIYLNCKKCNKIIRTTKGTLYRNKSYCSRECAGSWRGGITPLITRLRMSKEYKIWRTSVFERDNYTCIWCGARSGNGKSVILNADHIKPFCDYPELRFVIDNGRTLCIDCHRKTDTFGIKIFKNREGFWRANQ